MGRIVVTEFITLDGVTEDPQLWSQGYWNDDIMAVKSQELESAEAQLLGRVTYDTFAAAWPSQSGDPFTDKFNAMPKYVATRSNPELTWNNSHPVRTLDEIAKLRQEIAGDLLVAGSMSLVNDLLKAGLVDELRLITYPVVVGKGKRLIQDGTSAKLELTETRQCGQAVLTVYHPAA